MSKTTADGLRSPFKFPRDYAPPMFGSTLNNCFFGALQNYDTQHRDGVTGFSAGTLSFIGRPEDLQYPFQAGGLGTRPSFSADLSLPSSPNDYNSGLGIAQPDNPQGTFHTHGLGVDFELSDGLSSPTLPKTPIESPYLRTPPSSSTISSMERDTKIGMFFQEKFEGGHGVIAWTSPSPDYSIPMTDDEKECAVKKLVSAIRNNANCKEKMSSKTFVNRWSANAKYYTAEEIESLAWDTVEAMVQVHNNGWTKKVYDLNLRKQITQTMEWTFEHRLEKVAELLMFSKRTCEDLLKGEKLHSVIGAPHVLQSRTISNSKSNERKAARIRRATALEKAEKEEALARGEPIEDKKKGMKRARSDDEYDEGFPVTPSRPPVKKARTGGTMKTRGAKSGNA